MLHVSSRTSKDRGHPTFCCRLFPLLYHPNWKHHVLTGGALLAFHAGNGPAGPAVSVEILSDICCVSKAFLCQLAQILTHSPNKRREHAPEEGETSFLDSFVPGFFGFFGTHRTALEQMISNTPSLDALTQAMAGAVRNLRRPLAQGL